MHVRKPIIAVAVLAVAVSVVAAEDQQAKTSKSSPNFIRLQTDEDGEMLGMQTAVVSYVPADGKNPGLVVDLVGAVHVGEKSYYEALNKDFVRYDALLYELVAPKKAVPRRGQPRGGGALMGMQAGMQSMLGLEHQLDAIDYTVKNFVHADMSPKEFAQSMKDRDEDFTKLFFRMLGNSIAVQSADPTHSGDLALLAALFASDRELRMKRLMAQQFDRLGGRIRALDGPQGSTIITERNKKALEVLTREIAAGKKQIGIFYGAGHLADMERRLVDDFGLKRDKERWLTAWDLRDKNEDAKDDRGDK